MFVRLLIIFTFLSAGEASFAQDDGTFPESGNIPREQAIRYLDEKGVAELQQELIRAQCFAGPADGVWGRLSHEALMDFNVYSDVEMASVDADIEALKLVRETPGIVCPRRGSREPGQFFPGGLQ